MNKFFHICALFVAVMAFSSCSNKDKGIYPFKEEAKFLVVKLQGSDKWSIVNISNGDIVARNAISGEPSAVHEDLFYVNDTTTGLYNYYNVQNCLKPINSKPYCSATNFNGGYAVACLPGDNLQVIDKNCETVKKLPSSIISVSLFFNERAIVKNDKDLFGFIDTKGDMVISPRFGLANHFVFDDAALVSEASSLMAIDKNGDKLFSFNSDKYIPIGRFFVNGTLKVMTAKDNSIVYLDKKGKETADTLEIPKKIREINYREVKHVGKDRYMVIKGDRMGLVDDDNKTLISIEYDAITNLTPNRFVVAEGGVMMIVDEKGKQVGDARFVDFKNCNRIDEGDIARKK
ncbi:MAG: WG repeat-containing protein [Muribaculaceae bacterium]|nr:WG repeat-containing protein [Muribaculaceae bacterium]